MTVGMRPSASSGRDESLRMAGNAAASASPGTAEASGAGIGRRSVAAAAYLNFEPLLQAVCDKNGPHYAAKEAGRVTCAILGLGRCFRRPIPSSHAQGG